LKFLPLFLRYENFSRFLQKPQSPGFKTCGHTSSKKTFFSLQSAAPLLTSLAREKNLLDHLPSFYKEEILDSADPLLRIYQENHQAII
jgi:hypothetical protein